MPSRRPTHPPLNPRTAMVYFSLHTEDYNIEDDASEGDKAAQALLDEPQKLIRLEDKALKELSRKFGQRIDNEGHDGNGDLVCKLVVTEWAEVKAMQDVINANLAGYGTDDTMALDAPYMVARDFRFYPDGVNDNFYGEERGAAGSWEEWLKANKPATARSRAGSKRKNPSAPRRDAFGRFVRSRR